MKRLDTIGLIIKKEKLASYEASIPLNELILEDLAPFPGYYDSFHVHLPDKDLITSHLFFVLKEFDYFNDDRFIRMTLAIKAATGIEFDAVPGQLQLFNINHPCIRIRLQHMDTIPPLADAYKGAGMDFVRYRNVKPYDSLIKIKTFFPLEELDEGIYHHTDHPELYFITIPFMPDWETFEEITLKVRSNAEFKHFDAALASAYTRQGMLEMVRVYTESCTSGQLQELRRNYFREMNRELGK
jgi:hypothetical protein